MRSTCVPPAPPTATKAVTPHCRNAVPRTHALPSPTSSRSRHSPSPVPFRPLLPLAQAPTEPIATFRDTEPLKEHHGALADLPLAPPRPIHSRYPFSPLTGPRTIQPRHSTDDRRQRPSNPREQNKKLMRAGFRLFSPPAYYHRPPTSPLRRLSTPRSNNPFAASITAAARPRTLTMVATPEEIEAMAPPGYSFPEHRLRLQQSEPDREPLVLVAPGSYSPITFLHLRMAVMAADYVRYNTNFELIGSYLSPVSDAYKKRGLAPACHRRRMCEIAAEQTSRFLMVDPWEAEQTAYVPTALVLDHFEHEINVKRGGCNGKRVRIAVLAGADLINTMSQPGVWSPSDLRHILGDFGAFVLERAGVNIDEALGNLKEYEDQIYYIPQVVPNDVSSTKIRLLLRRNMSIDYLIPAEVIKYIDEHGLYNEDDTATNEKGKEKEVQ
ncbi:nicotinate nucleotide adenylyltransferase [Colletotrichum paranaense]|nr:nicotinate nucleotide adenylyltransferase [Colletotrichum paranaense]KAK1542592.1 nicotinate nucleotide adenylyltransferase [Colletotrichum paranaense]